MKSKWPNFLVLGPPKCGTRSLYFYLKQHPDVFMSEVKEPHFFAFHNEQLTLPIDDIHSQEYKACEAFYLRTIKNATTDIKTYTALFNNVNHEKVIGEASTTSLYHPPAPLNIKKYTPNAKMIAILRNPVERTFSAYMDAIRRGAENRSLSDAIKQEPIDSDHIWWGPGEFYYVRPSFYSKQIQRYFDVFDRKQIKIYLFDDFKKDPIAMIQDIYRFLEVDDTFQPDMRRIENISGVPVGGYLDSLIDCAHDIYSKSKPLKPIKEFLWRGFPKKWKGGIVTSRRNARVVKHFKKDKNEANSKWETYYDGKFIKPTIPSDTKQFLTDIYHNDVLVLQDMLDRDLSAWLSNKT